jgi:hypothetical protein
VPLRNRSERRENDSSDSVGFGNDVLFIGASTCVACGSIGVGNDERGTPVKHRSAASAAASAKCNMRGPMAAFPRVTVPTTPLFKRCLQSTVFSTTKREGGRTRGEKWLYTRSTRRPHWTSIVDGLGGGGGRANTHSKNSQKINDCSKEISVFPTPNPSLTFSKKDYEGARKRNCYKFVLVLLYFQIAIVEE